MEYYSLLLDRYWLNNLMGGNLVVFISVSQNYSTPKAEQVQKFGCN